MKPAGPPFGDRLPPIHGGMPPHFESFHERFKQFEVDDVVFDDKDIDGRHGAVQQPGRQSRMIGYFLRSSVRWSFGAR